MSGTLLRFLTQKIPLSAESGKGFVPSPHHLLKKLDENFFRLYIKPLPRDFGFLFYFSLPAKYPAEVLRRGRLMAIFFKAKRGHRATRVSPAGVPRRDLGAATCRRRFQMRSFDASTTATITNSDCATLMLIEMPNVSVNTARSTVTGSIPA